MGDNNVSSFQHTMVGPGRHGGISSSFRALMGKKDCFRYPMNVGWWIKIRDTHVQNAIGLMIPDIPN